ncbi:hypothetical protein EVAR_931_1 [Eumeta japonica]|uniref:Uncharacterized protein n=1 Tax=Eumeta variegata TaxID=151549 RepID=A0A4C1SE20_EUMVA|nr:hypothetical protein EVAR_931_1 [Eumeta japonica]
MTVYAAYFTSRDIESRDSRSTPHVPPRCSALNERNTARRARQRRFVSCPNPDRELKYRWVFNSTRTPRSISRDMPNLFGLLHRTASVGTERQRVPGRIEPAQWVHKSETFDFKQKREVQRVGGQ